MSPPKKGHWYPLVLGASDHTGQLSWLGSSASHGPEPQPARCRAQMVASTSTRNAPPNRPKAHPGEERSERGAQAIRRQCQGPSGGTVGSIGPSFRCPGSTSSAEGRRVRSRSVRAKSARRGDRRGGTTASLPNCSVGRRSFQDATNGALRAFATNGTRWRKRTGLALPSRSDRTLATELFRAGSSSAWTGRPSASKRLFVRVPNAVGALSVAASFDGG